MPEMDGIELLKKALEIDPNLIGIIMTGQGTIQTAVEAMKSGAFDYVLKPFRIQAMLPILDRAMAVRQLKMENVRLKRYVERLTFESARYRIVGTSPAVRKVVAMIEKVAPTDATVLIRGPSGAGKELVARALHGNSPRNDKPLVTVNCATLQESLLESELFGHEKGAFTGADKAKAGLFEVAEGGTLFIDEIAEMAAAMQAKLLRVLEDGHYRRVGGIQEYHADVRVVAATNKPLEEAQKAGKFREDLYYRLNVVHITVPPLRTRAEDIPLLVEHFVRRYVRESGKRIEGLALEALEMLRAYRWPGNVRELQNVIERAVVLTDGPTIGVDDLPLELSLGVAPAAAEESLPLNEASDRFEQQMVLRVLDRSGGNVSEAARLLGLHRNSLKAKLSRWKIRARDLRSDAQ
jgi:DNA-binding NtrC family response regulator